MTLYVGNFQSIQFTCSVESRYKSIFQIEVFLVVKHTAFFQTLPPKQFMSNSPPGSTDEILCHFVH